MEIQLATLSQQSRTYILFIILSCCAAVAGAADIGLGKSKAGKIYAYTAKLKHALSVSKSMNLAGVNWVCRATTCNANGPWPNPSVTACRKLANRVGVIVSYGHPAKRLQSKQLQQCNSTASMKNFIGSVSNTKSAGLTPKVNKSGKIINSNISAAPVRVPTDSSVFKLLNLARRSAPLGRASIAGASPSAPMVRARIRGGGRIDLELLKATIYNPSKYRQPGYISIEADDGTNSLKERFEISAKSQSVISFQSVFYATPKLQEKYNTNRTTNISAQLLFHNRTQVVARRPISIQLENASPRQTGPDLSLSNVQFNAKALTLYFGGYRASPLQIKVTYTNRGDDIWGYSGLTNIILFEGKPETGLKKISPNSYIAPSPTGIALGTSKTITHLVTYRHHGLLHEGVWLTAEVRFSSSFDVNPANNGYYLTFMLARIKNTRGYTHIIENVSARPIPASSSVRVRIKH